MHKTLLFALLAVAFAGCTDAPGADETSMPGNGFAPQEGNQGASDDRASLSGQFSTCDAGFCIDAVATNEGEPIYVSDICVTPWTESMAQGGKAVQKSEPMAVCMAFGVRPMETNEQLEANFTWDGRLWDDDAQAYKDAPEGDYVWSIQFTYYTGSNGEGRNQLELDFPVVIGAT